MKLDFLRVAALAVAIAVPAAGTIAFAQAGDEGGPGHHGKHWGGDHGRHRGPGFGGEFGGIELTDAQKTQMKTLHESHRAATESLNQEIGAKKQELHQLMQGTSFDENAVRAKLTEIAAVEAKLMGERFRMRQESMAILTPEQKTQLEQRRDQFKQRFHERRQQKLERKQEPKVEKSV